MWTQFGQGFDSPHFHQKVGKAIFHKMAFSLRCDKIEIIKGN